jgi:hypothetical protein
MLSGTWLAESSKPIVLSSVAGDAAKLKIPQRIIPTISIPVMDLQGSVRNPTPLALLSVTLNKTAVCDLVVLTPKGKPRQSHVRSLGRPAGFRNVRRRNCSLIQELLEHLLRLLVWVLGRRGALQVRLVYIAALYLDEKIVVSVEDDGDPLALGQFPCSCPDERDHYGEAFTYAN